MKKHIFVYTFVVALFTSILTISFPAFATTRYIGQTAGAFSGGTACNGHTTITPATFNGITNLPGDVNYICGAVTAASGPILTPQGNGSSGNPVRIIWDSGARLSVQHGAVINIGSLGYYLFDGGIPCGPGTSCDTIEAAHQSTYASGQAGIIEATANGTAPTYPNQDAGTQAFMGCNNCSNIEIRNMIIRNLYVHVAPSTNDGSGSVDTGTFALQCTYGAGCGGTISIHDSTLHDMGNGISLEGLNSATVAIYNIDFYHDNWALENSGNGTRTVLFHNNRIHDASNWDTSDDSFHHNGIHNYMNVPSDSLGLYVYNNISDGDWGSCCTTATFLFTEVAPPASFYVFNNVVLQNCGNTAMAEQSYTVNSGTGPSFYNNTFIGCGTTPGNVEAVDLYGTSMQWENNVDQGYGQYVSVGKSATFSALDYNAYGPIGNSGNSPWQCGSTGASSFSQWQSSCRGDSHGLQNSNLGLNLTGLLQSLLSGATGLLQSGSVLIGGGANLTNLCSGNLTPLCSDITGTARPATGPWTIGAYSSSSGSSNGPSSPTGLTGTVVQQ